MRRHATLLLVRGRWRSEGEPWGDDLTDGEVPSLHAGLCFVRLHGVVKAPKPQQRLFAFAGLPSWSVLAELVAAGNGYGGQNAAPAALCPLTADEEWYDR